MKYCPECGVELKPTDKFCSNCGYAVAMDSRKVNTNNSVEDNSSHAKPESSGKPPENTLLNKKPAKVSSKSVKKKKKHPILTILLVLLVIGVIGSLADSSSSKSKSSEESKTSAEKNTSSASQATTENVTDWLSYYAENEIEVVPVPVDVLYEYSSAYTGSTIITSMTVKSTGSDTLKAETENNDTYAYSVVAHFPDKAEIKGISAGDVVIISGSVEEKNSIDLFGSGSTVSLQDSHIILSGITSDEIEEGRDEQTKIAKKKIDEIEKERAKALAEEIKAYKKDCKKVDYSDVERNPSQYEGKKIQVTGRVVQVQEGFFDSVTLRVDQGGGKDWYVTYTRPDESESRILEGDQITFYGECDGVTSYTSVIGNRVTIPSLKAKYHS